VCGGETGSEKGKEVRDLGVEVAVDIGNGCARLREVEESDELDISLAIGVLCKLREVTFLLSIFSSKARRRPSIKSAFYMLDVAFIKFKALLAILMRSLMPRSLLS
jgi:hypothetical protein